jgi:hypothetical protein
MVVVRRGWSTRGGDAKQAAAAEDRKEEEKLQSGVKIRASRSPSDGQWLLVVCTTEKKSFN